jgi:hypothetical protein
MLGVFALPALIGFALSSAFLPPELLQPATMRATPATSAAQRSLVVLDMLGPPVVVGVARY